MLYAGFKELVQHMKFHSMPVALDTFALSVNVVIIANWNVIVIKQSQFNSLVQPKLNHRIQYVRLEIGKQVRGQ